MSSEEEKEKKKNATISYLPAFKKKKKLKPLSASNEYTAQNTAPLPFGGYWDVGDLSVNSLTATSIFFAFLLLSLFPSLLFSYFILCLLCHNCTQLLMLASLSLSLQSRLCSRPFSLSFALKPTTSPFFLLFPARQKTPLVACRQSRLPGLCWSS